MRWAAFVLGGVLLGAFGALASAAAQVAPPAQAMAQIRDPANQVVATASFREGRNEVLITIDFPAQAVLSGTHAIHINQTGRCDPPNFATSGNIFNPFNKKHGRQNPAGAEVGDLPNVNVSAGSRFNTSAIGATLGTGAGSLINRSLVMYSGQDDQQTEPDGNPGSPIACGVIVAAGSAAPSPITRPSISPVAVAKPVAAPTPILILPTSVPLAATTPSTQSRSNGPSTFNSVFIAVLGFALIGAGVLLRRPLSRSG